MTISPGSPDTIVLVHGFWVTPRSWEDWIAHDEAKGYTVLAPAYPGFEIEVEALNADPTPVAEVTVPQIIERYESVIDALDAPPIIIGHSAGGAFTQILLDHGRGAVGVALNSAPTEGVRIAPPSQVKSTFMPPGIQPSNARHDKGKTTTTEVKEYPGRAHLMTAQAGWQEIADDVLDWAVEQAVRP